MYQKNSFKRFSFQSGATSAFVVLLALILAVSPVFAATAGPRDAGTGQDVTGVGTETWSNPGNITTAGSPYATALLGTNDTSHYLRGTNYGFAIPDGSTIDGISVSIRRQSSGSNLYDNAVRLVKGGTLTGDNKAVTGTAWPTSMGTATYPPTATNDKWGTTWTAADINSANFGVVLAGHNSSSFSSRTASVDYMRITVIYTLPGTATTVDCGSGTPAVPYGSSIACVATVTRLAGTLNTPGGSVSWTTGGSGSFATSSCTLSGAGGTATCSVDYTPGAVGTGSHLITAAYAGSTNFTGSSGQQTVTVNKLVMTVTAEPKSKTYGAADPALTYTYTPALVAGDSFSGALVREVGEDVDTYAILQNTLALNSNYTITYTANDFVISPLAVTVTAEPKSKTYGAADPALTYTQAPELVAGDSFSGALEREAGEDVDTYAILKGTLALSSNYTLSFVSNDFVINPLGVTVTAEPKSKTYGAADPALTYTYVPELVAGDSFSGALIREIGEDADTYAILQGTLALGDNYAITYAGNDFVINPLAVAMSAEPKSKTYGAADPALTYTYTPELVAGDSFSGALIREIGEDADTYAILQGTLALGDNYAITYAGNDFVINPLAVAISAEPKSKIYGAADPALTYTYAPELVTGDSFSGALVREAGEDVDTYAILKGTLTPGDNYVITYTANDFIISPLAMTVAAEPKSKIYGAADPALTYTHTPELVAGDSFSGALTREMGEDVDTYAILKGTLTPGDNYTITFTGNDFAINPLAVTVTAEPKSKTYGAADPALTYTYAPALVAGDSFSGALVREVGEDVESYAILKNTLALSSNYTLNFVGANLTITQAVLTVTADNKSRQYLAVNPPLTYTITGLMNGDLESVVSGSPVLTTTAVQTSPGGLYAITITAGDLQAGNYTFTFVNGTLTVNAYWIYLPSILH